MSHLEALICMESGWLDCFIPSSARRHIGKLILSPLFGDFHGHVWVCNTFEGGRIEAFHFGASSRHSCGMIFPLRIAS